MRRYLVEIFYLSIGLILIGAGFLFPSVVTRAIGYVLILMVAVLLSMRACFTFIKKEKFDSEENAGIVGCLPMIIIAILIFIGVSNRDYTYISSHGSKQHIYPDCHSIKTSHVKHVRRGDAILLGKYKTCKICLERRKKLREDERRRLELEERQRMIESLYECIEDLKQGINPDSVIESLIEEFNFDVSSYYHEYYDDEEEEYDNSDWLYRRL